MVKTFAFTFSINGLVSQSFSGSMNAARNGLLKLRQQGKDLQGQLKELDAALYKNEIDFEGYAQKANKVKAELKALELQQTKLNNVISAKNNLKGAVTDLGIFSMGVYAASRPIVGMIETAADFEQGMSKVQAITRASAADVGLLSEQAKELGRTTKFTARQSADAMSYLGMAGWNTQEIMKGMPGLLNLAAAGATDIARTADIVSDDLTAFGLGADQAQHMADVFAYTITRTNTNVEMLGETMKYAAPVAHAFGASMEETAALAGLMANAGIKASNAGTALRSGFLRLAGPPKQAAKAMEALGMDMSEMSKQQAEAQAAMKALGIEMSDTNGPRKMSAIITELRNKMQGLSREERLASMGAIFGKNASAGWLAVIDSAPDKFDALVNEMDKCDGEAARMAATMNNNAKGALMRLKSATEGISLALGGVFLPMLADAGDKVAGLASSVAKAASENPELVKSIGLVTVAMVGAAGAFKAAQVAYAAYKVVSATIGLIQLGNAAATATATAATVAGTAATSAATVGTWAFNAALYANPIGLVVVGIAGLIAAGYMLYKNWDKVSAGLVRGWNWVKNTAVGVFNWYTDTLAALPSKAGYAVGYVIGWFMQIPGKLMGVIGSLDGVGQSFIDKAKEWGQLGFNGLIDAFLNLPSRLAEIASNAWESAKKAVGSFSVGLTQGMNASGANGPAAAIAANAKGGIYSKGAFLTTFAEESPEAAIPIDGSKRAKNLWIRTGQMLGLLQPEKEAHQNRGLQAGRFDRKPKDRLASIRIPEQDQAVNEITNNVTLPGIFAGLLKRLQEPEKERAYELPVLNVESAAAAAVPAVTVKSETQGAPVVTPAVNPVIRIPEGKRPAVNIPEMPATVFSPTFSPVVTAGKQKQVETILGAPSITAPPAVTQPAAAVNIPSPLVQVNPSMEAPQAVVNPAAVSIMQEAPAAPVVNTGRPLVTLPGQAAVNNFVSAEAEAPAVNTSVNASAETPEVINKLLVKGAPVIRNMIQAVADSPVIRTFVNAFGAEQKAPVISPANVKTVVNTPAAQGTESSPVYSPMVNIPEAAAPDVTVNPEVQASTPLVSVQPAAPVLPPVVTAAAAEGKTSPVIQGKADSPLRVLGDFARNEKTETVNNNNSPINVTYAPNNVFNITGTESPEKIRSVGERMAEISMAKFRELMEKYQREQRRVQYG